MRNVRLNKMASIFEEKIIYDIGSDHGYLVKNLFDEKKINKAYVGEINEQPLKNAKKSLQAYESVEFYLSDGFKEIDEIKAESGIVIAGVGGALIAQIISNDIKKLSDCKMYLQPNNKEDYLRIFLNENGFSIECEYVVFDADKYYSIFVVVKGAQKINDDEIHFGKNVVMDETYNNYLKHLLIKYKTICEELNATGNKSKEIEYKYNYLIKYFKEKHEN